MGREEDRRRKFGREVIGEIEIDVESAQVAAFLVLDLVDLIVRKDLAAGCLLDMRQGHEIRPAIARARGSFGSHLRQAVPGDAVRQLDPDAALHGLRPPDIITPATR